MLIVKPSVVVNGLMVLLLFSAEKVVSRKKEIVSLSCNMKSLSTKRHALTGHFIRNAATMKSNTRALLSGLESGSQQRDSDVNQVTYILSNY